MQAYSGPLARSCSESVPLNVNSIDELGILLGSCKNQGGLVREGYMEQGGSEITQFSLSIILQVFLYGGGVSNWLCLEGSFRISCFCPLHI